MLIKCIGNFDDDIRVVFTSQSIEITEKIIETENNSLTFSANVSVDDKLHVKTDGLCVIVSMKNQKSVSLFSNQLYNKLRNLFKYETKDYAEFVVNAVKIRKSIDFDENNISIELPFDSIDSIIILTLRTLFYLENILIDVSSVAYLPDDLIEKYIELIPKSAGVIKIKI